MKIRLLHTIFRMSDTGYWVGLYVDDKLVLEGCDLSENVILAIMDYIPGNNSFANVWVEENFEEYDNQCPACWPEELG